MPTTVNDDNGSLFTATDRLSVGDQVKIVGEPRARTVTYVMGSDRKGWRACFKGQGAVPTGSVTWERVTRTPGNELSPRPPATGVESPPAREGIGVLSRKPAIEGTGQVEPVAQSLRVIGVDFGGPREVEQQRRKILAVEAHRLTDGEYRIRAEGLNARLVREDPPGWSALELAQAIESDNRAGLVAMDFPFSIPAELIASLEFAQRVMRQRPFGTWLEFNSFVAAKAPIACSTDLSPFEKWRDKQFWKLRATDMAASAQPPLKDSYQTLFNMTLLGAALLARLRITGDYRVDPFDTECGQAGTLLEVYPGVAMRRLGKPDYKRDPSGAIETMLKYCSDRGIKIDLDPDVRSRCEKYGMDRTPPDPDGSDALIALCTGILFKEGRCERVLENSDDARVAREGAIWAPVVKDRPGAAGS